MIDIRQRDIDDILVLEITGRATLSADQVGIRRAVDNALERGYRHVLVDLGELRIIDSSGLGELVVAHTVLQAAGGELRLLRPRAAVTNALERAQLLEVIDIHPSESSAVAAFRCSHCDALQAS